MDTPRAPEWRNDPAASPVLVACDRDDCQTRAYAPLPVLRESGWEVTRLAEQTLCPPHNTRRSMAVKLDLKRKIMRADLTPRVMKFDPVPNVKIAMWNPSSNSWDLVEGKPGETMTLGDALRTTYSLDLKTDTRETKSTRTRLLYKLNRAIMKGVPFELSPDDQKFTLDQAGEGMESVVYGQIEAAIDGKPGWDEDEELQADPSLVVSD